MRNQRKGAVKGLVVFLSAMATLTFLSRTIYNGTLPKVEVARVSGGILVSEISAVDYILHADRSERVDIPVDLSEYRLRVDQVAVRQYASVRNGDEMVIFDSVVGANVLEKAESAYARAEEALVAWDQRYLGVWRKLNAEIKSVTLKMTEAVADHNELYEQLTGIQDELMTLERTRMLDGMARSEQEYALMNAKTKRDALRKLDASGWALSSTMDGIVSVASVKPGDEYAGLLQLLTIIPQDSMIRVGIETNSTIKIESPDFVTVYAGDTQPQSRETGWSFAGETKRGDMRVFWAEPLAEIGALDDLKMLTFSISSEYYPQLVPSGAVIGDAVFVLDSRFDAFGMEEYFARRVETRGLISDGKRTYVPFGLSGTDQVIVKWDRPFSDGDTVLLPQS